MRTVLFFRDFRRFHGGHLKVRDYFDHVLASPAFTPRIAFSPESSWDRLNPWRDAREYVVGSGRSIHPDVFFVAGHDWLMLDRHPDAGANVPVVNLVQHVRHADEGGQLIRFLSRKAIRICVSDEVADAVRETGRAHGPLVVVPNGIDLVRLPAADGAGRAVDVLIVAVKKPHLGTELARRLKRRGRRVVTVAEPLPQPAFLSHMRQARTTVYLPNEEEGFYLPALEGMALGTLVVCPDCVGNRSFCLPGHNCLRPAYAIEDLVGAAESALALPAEGAERLRANARRTAESHSLLGERQAFLNVLHAIDHLWSAGALSRPSHEVPESEKLPPI